MTGDSMREFDALQFTDGYGDVWTVRPSDAEPGDVDVRVDTEVGPVGLVIPARDVAQLTSRLMAAKFAAERRAARVVNAVAPVPPTTDGTCNHGGEDDDTGEFPGATAHVGEVS